MLVFFQKSSKGDNFDSKLHKVSVITLIENPKRPGKPMIIQQKS